MWRVGELVRVSEDYVPSFWDRPIAPGSDLYDRGLALRGQIGEIGTNNSGHFTVNVRFKNVKVVHNGRYRYESYHWYFYDDAIWPINRLSEGEKNERL